MLALLGSKGCVARFGAHEPWREPQHTDSPAFTTGHPRMCGERRCVSRLLKRQYGSSPHARGTRSARSGRRPRQTVHPRMYGERARSSQRQAASVGSSPHVRGTPKLQLLDAVVVRFIPACAGNAHGIRRFALHDTVHPRMRGERNLQSGRRSTADGSSPHARGTPLHDLDPIMANRFIPACAGNAPSAGPATGSASVHPRMRGERTLPRMTAPMRIGSSPHARGTRVPV